MSDPVANAAAQLAAIGWNKPQEAEPTMLEKAMDTIHDLEAKVEHLIHPDESGNAVASPSVTASTVGEATTPSASAGGEADLPNAASVAGEPTAEVASAPNADGAGITESSVASSAEPEAPKMVAMDLASDAPLHFKIAQHLEAIYTLAREHVEAPVVADTSALKTHIGNILHRISNGMQVTEGELVAKLEALYRML